ncbi:MAG: hypothetical protein KC708_17380, partial [Anaerolineae bacterium]|nr:hypothetical protein [Anaerolineae bacterium]
MSQIRMSQKRAIFRNALSLLLVLFLMLTSMSIQGCTAIATTPTNDDKDPRAQAEDELVADVTDALTEMALIAQ